MVVKLCVQYATVIIIIFLMFSILVQSHISVSRQKPSANQLGFLSHFGCPANGSTDDRIVCRHRQSPPPRRYSTATRETRQVSAAPPYQRKSPSSQARIHPICQHHRLSDQQPGHRQKGKKTKPMVVLHSCRVSVQCWTDFRLLSQFRKDALCKSGATDSHLGGPQLTIPHQKIQQ